MFRDLSIFLVGGRLQWSPQFFNLLYTLNWIFFTKGTIFSTKMNSYINSTKVTSCTEIYSFFKKSRTPPKNFNGFKKLFSGKKMGYKKCRKSFVNFFGLVFAKFNISQRVLKKRFLNIFFSRKTFRVVNYFLSSF